MRYVLLCAFLYRAYTDFLQQYIAQQRDAFLKGVPPPDFPGGLGETGFPDRANVKDIQSEAGRVAMGLDPVNLKGRNNNLEKEINDILFP